MKKIRAAVIGVGYLGRFHAQKYAALEDCDLIGVVDANAEAAARVKKAVEGSDDASGSTSEIGTLIAERV